MPNPLNHYALIPVNSDNLNSFKLNNTNTLIAWEKNLLTDTSQLINELKLPLTTSIDIRNFSQTTDLIDRPSDSSKIRLYALRNILDKKSSSNESFSFSSSLGEKFNQELTLVSIPSIFYGASIAKGTVSLKINYSGTLVSKIEDTKYNGELLETYGKNTGSVAGVVLYDEGFIVLTGSWSLGNNLKWSTFSKNSTADLLSSASYDIDFLGTNITPTMTLMAHAPKELYNYSNNPTFLEYGQNTIPETGSTFYKEKEYINIKNIVKYPYDNFIGDIQKETYISKICIFDENKNLIAVAKPSIPIRKTLARDYTFKLKLDY